MWAGGKLSQGVDAETESSSHARRMISRCSRTAEFEFSTGMSKTAQSRIRASADAKIQPSVAHLVQDCGLLRTSIG
jgi:hypothetical protein